MLRSWFSYALYFKRSEQSGIYPTKSTMCNNISQQRADVVRCDGLLTLRRLECAKVVCSMVMLKALPRSHLQLLKVKSCSNNASLKPFVFSSVILLSKPFAVRFLHQYLPYFSLHFYILSLRDNSLAILDIF